MGDERVRRNEAALVAGINPEIDEVEENQRGVQRATTLSDATLQRAVDLITAIGIFTKTTK